MKKAYLDFLYSLGVFNIKLGLSNMRKILDALDNPHQHPAVIHLAGTNGKGSTLVTLESLLLKSGFTTGATISPHLISFNERFRINGISVSDAEMDRAFVRVCGGCGISLDGLESYSGNSIVSPTFFEFAMAMAFVLFDAAKVDYILLETGLGGRLDASNVIENPLACVLTKIDLDHQEFLGDSIEEITSEKLGIVKPGAVVFAANQTPGVSNQIRSFCQEQENRLVAFADDYHVEVLSDQGGVCFSGALLDSETAASQWSLTVPQPGLIGAHQHENMATALSIYHHLVPAHRRLAEAAMTQVIEDLRWDGRLQYLTAHKNILLDGAHNASGMARLFDFLLQHHAQDRILCAIGWMEGKEVLDALSQSKTLKITFQPVKFEMLSDHHAAGIQSSLSRRGYATLPVISTGRLVETELEPLLQQFDLILVAGSLYLVGEFLSRWQACDTH